MTGLGDLIRTARDIRYVEIEDVGAVIRYKDTLMILLDKGSE